MKRIKFIPIILAIMLSACMPTDEVKPDLGTVIKLSASDYSIKQDNEKTNTYIVEFLTQMATPIWSYDGDVKTDRTSSFYFPKKGEYNIILKAYNKAGISDSILIPVSIAVSDPMAFDIEGGNMEEQGVWLTNNLNATVQPTLAWGSATIKPTAGAGNALYITSTVTNATSNLAIYQAVSLLAGSTYEFDAAYKYTSIVQSWCEVYIGATAPTTGSDYTDLNGKLVGKIGGWNLPSSTDGTFKLNGIHNIFIPPTTGTYYFVLKVGVISWNTTTASLELSIDKLSFKRI